MDITRLTPWEKRTKFTVGPCPRRDVGQPYRHILGTYTDGNQEHSLHATKGWRTRQVLPDGDAIGRLLSSIPSPTRQPPRYAATIDQKAYMKGGNYGRR